MTLRSITRLRVLLFRTRRKQTNRRSFRIKRTIMTRARFLTPFQMLRCLICRRRFSSTALRFNNRLRSTVSKRMRIIRISRRTKTIYTRFLFNVLRRRDNLACTSYTFSASGAIVPICFIRRITTCKDVNVLCRVDIYAMGYFRTLGSICQTAGVQLFCEFTG